MNKLGKHDLTGKQINYLFVIERAEKPQDVIIGKYTYWKCLCVCGKEVVVSRYSLNNGKLSCGCIKKPRAKENKPRKEYINKKNIPPTFKRFRGIWYKMKGRCYNINDNQYHNYGAKGVAICDRWLDFENFKSDMYDSYLDFEISNGEKSATIDRIDPKGNYELKNCRWATQLEQARNRSNNIEIEVEGVVYGTLSQLAEAYNISYNTVHQRYYLGKRELELVRKDNLKHPEVVKDSNRRVLKQH